jgi:hypothetical protein
MGDPDDLSEKELDDMVFQLFAEAEREVAAEEAATGSSVEKTSPSGTSSAKVTGASSPGNLPPTGPKSKVSPAMQRFALDVPKKK